MTWSPLACGIISGKYDGRVPPYSRASLKVDAARVRSSDPVCASLSVYTLPLLELVCLSCLSGAHLMSVCVCVLCRVDAVCCVPCCPSSAVYQLVFAACHTPPTSADINAPLRCRTAAGLTFNGVCWLDVDHSQQIFFIYFFNHNPNNPKIARSTGDL